MATAVQSEGFQMIFRTISILALFYYVVTGYEIAFIIWLLSSLLMFVSI